MPFTIMNRFSPMTLFIVIQSAFHLIQRTTVAVSSILYWQKPRLDSIGDMIWQQSTLTTPAFICHISPYQTTHKLPNKTRCNPWNGRLSAIGPPTYRKTFAVELRNIVRVAQSQRIFKIFHYTYFHCRTPLIHGVRVSAVQATQAVRVMRTPYRMYQNIPDYARLWVVYCSLVVAELPTTHALIIHMYIYSVSGVRSQIAGCRLGWGMAATYKQTEE